MSYQWSRALLDWTNFGLVNLQTSEPLSQKAGKGGVDFVEFLVATVLGPKVLNRKLRLFACSEVTR